MSSRPEPTPPNGIRTLPKKAGDGRHELELALDVARAGLWEWWVDSGEMRFGDRCFALLGYAPGELPSRFDTFAELLHPDDRQPTLARATSEMAEGRLEYEFEFRLREKHGGYRWLLARSRATESDEAGRATHIVGLILDIHELKTADRQHERSGKAQSEHARLEAQRMDAMGRLAGGVAHDFNNLLSVILSYSTLAADSLPEGDPLKEDMEEVTKAGERAAALTRQLLAFSRRQVLEPRLVDLNELISGLKDRLVRVLGEDIELCTRLSANLDPITADPAQLEQVLMNLAANSRDATTPGGRVSIETDNVDIDDEFAESHGVAPGRYVVMAVRDSGVGMDQNTLRHLFEPFFTTKDPGKGAGLGLSTVFGIVRQSGGFVLPESEPGCGTTVKVLLPSAPPHRKARSGLDAPK